MGVSLLHMVSILEEGGSHFLALKFSVPPERISSTSDLVIVSTFFLLMRHICCVFFLSRLVAMDYG